MSKYEYFLKYKFPSDPNKGIWERSLVTKGDKKTEKDRIGIHQGVGYVQPEGTDKGPIP